VEPFESKRFRLKMAFLIVAVVLLALLPLLTPYLSLWHMGKVPLSPMQMVYVVLSIEIVAAVYLWGVGSWSRFEPPRSPAGSAAPITGGSVQTQPPAGTPTAAGPGNVPPPGQKVGG
jgi:hypothetical protein